MDWNYHGEHMTTGGWIFMMLGMLVLIVLVVVLIIWLVSQRTPSGVSFPPGMSAREALDHRLVSGEITIDQYDELRSKLDPSVSQGAGPPGPLAAPPG